MDDRKEISLPPPVSNWVNFLTDQQDWERYNQMCDEWPVNKILGYADNIQGEQELAQIFAKRMKQRFGYLM